MANVTVTANTPNITVDSTNLTVTVAETSSNIVVSQVASIANAQAITNVLSVTDTGGDGSLSYNNSTGVFTYTGPSASEVRAHISSVDNGGDGSLGYNSTTGVITYTGPSAADVRAHFSNTSPITLSSGVIGIDSDALFTGKTTDDLPQGNSNVYFSTSGATVNTTNLPEGTNQYFTTARANSAITTFLGDASNAPFSFGGNLNVTGDVEVSGNLNYRNVEDLYVRDQSITLNANAATDATVEIIANRPVAGSNTLLRWNETTDKWQFTNDGSTFYNIPASTSDLAEGTNLYYTNSRVLSAVSGNVTIGNLTVSGETVTQGNITMADNTHIVSAVDGGKITFGDSVANINVGVDLHPSGTTPNSHFAVGHAIDKATWTHPPALLVESNVNEFNSQGNVYIDVGGHATNTDGNFAVRSNATNVFSVIPSVGNNNIDVLFDGTGLSGGSFKIQGLSANINGLIFDTPPTSDTLLFKAANNTLRGSTLSYDATTDTFTYGSGANITINGNTTINGNVLQQGSKLYNATGTTFRTAFIGAYGINNHSDRSNEPMIVFSAANVIQLQKETTSESNITTTANIQGAYVKGNGSELTGLTTTQVSEGTNLYFTNARANTSFDTRLGTKTTDDLTQGSTNLYFSNSRVRDALTGTYTSNPSSNTDFGFFSYTSGTGEFNVRRGNVINQAYKINMADDSFTSYSNVFLPLSKQVGGFGATNDSFCELETSSQNLYYSPGHGHLYLKGELFLLEGNVSDGTGNDHYYDGSIILPNKIKGAETGATGFITVRDHDQAEPNVDVTISSQSNSHIIIDNNANDLSNVTYFAVEKSTTSDANSANTSEIFKISKTGAATFNQAFTFPTADGSADQVLKTYGNGLVRWANDTALADLTLGQMYVGSTSNTTIAVTPDGNFTSTGNAFSLSNSLTDVNTIATEASANLSLDTNTKAVKILKDFASETSQDTLILDSDGYRPTNYAGNPAVYPVYSGSGLRRNTLHEGTAVAGSPNVTVTASAVDFWYGTPSAGQRTDAFSNIAANCMFITKASAATTGNSTTSPFPPGTRILSVDATGFVITMTQNATANATFSQASGTGLFTGDGAHDPNTTFGELYVTNADWSGGSAQSIEFAQFTGSTDNLSYGESGPQDADLTTSVASGTITNGDYTVQQRSKLVTNKGFTASKYGFTVGDGATLSNRFENDNFPAKGINILHDGQATFSTDFGSTLTQSQFGIKQYTDNTTQASVLQYGPRLLLSSAKGKNTDDPFNTYPVQGQSLGQIGWQGTTGQTLTPSSLRPPVYINAIAAEDHNLGANTNIYFGAMSDSDNSSSSNKAHIYLASQDGKTIIAAGTKGTTKEDIYFAPAQQPSPGYAVNTTYDFGTIAGQKSWAKINYANTSLSSGAKLTVTHGQSRGAGTVGDQEVVLQRNDNSFNIPNQVINADNSPNNVFGPGVVGQSFDAIGSLTSSGNYIDGTAAVISGFTGSPYAALNGTTKYLKLVGVFGAISVYELYNDAALTSGFTSGVAGANNLGPGVFTYTAVQNSGVNAKSYSLSLEEQSDVLKIKEDNAVRLSIDTTETELFNRLQLYSLTTTEINALSSPQAGQVVYNSTLNQMCLYNGTAWQKITQATM